MKRLVLATLLGISVSSVLACSDDDDGGTLPGDTPCEKWKSLALRAGCDFPQDCSVRAACNEEAIAWLECTAKDVPGQCKCHEMTLQLNCEGSYLPNEGTAQCSKEFTAFSTCNQ